MITQELVSYIALQFRQGRTQEEIKHELLQIGWLENDLDQGINLASEQVLEPKQEISNQSLPPQKSKRALWKWILLGISLLFVAGISLFMYLFYQSVQNAPVMQQKVTTFLTAVSNKDYGSAYQLSSTNFQKLFTLDVFSKDMEIFKAQYSGFASVKQTNVSFYISIGQPAQYTYTGTITYNDGDIGDVQATFVKERGDWKINSIFAYVNVERLKKFQQATQSPVLGASTKR